MYQLNNRQYQPRVFYVPRHLYTVEDTNNILAWILLVITILFILWDGLLILFNFQIVFKLFELRDIRYIIEAVFLILATILKIFTMVMAIVSFTNKSKSNAVLMIIILIIVGINIIVTVYIAVIIGGKIALASWIGIGIDVLLHALTAVLTYFYDKGKPNEWVSLIRTPY